MANFDIGAGMGAATQFLSGYLKGKDKEDEKQKKLKQAEGVQKKLNELIQEGYLPTWKMDPLSGKATVSLQSPQVAQQKKQAEMSKRAETLKTEAAKSGISAQFAPGYPAGKQVEAIRSHIAARGGLSRPAAPITKTAALNILSDPYKAEDLKKNYPDVYNQVIKTLSRPGGKTKERIIVRKEGEEDSTVSADKAELAVKMGWTVIGKE